MLILPIKGKWFRMILSGEKCEEYREIKPYWTNRLSKLESPAYVMFRNGYGNSKPTMKCLVEIKEGYGRTEWGAEDGKRYYVLKILSVEKVEGDMNE